MKIAINYHPQNSRTATKLKYILADVHIVTLELWSDHKPHASDWTIIIYTKEYAAIVKRQQWKRLFYGDRIKLISSTIIVYPQNNPPLQRIDNQIPILYIAGKSKIAILQQLNRYLKRRKSHPIIFFGKTVTPAPHNRNYQHLINTLLDCGPFHRQSAIVAIFNHPLLKQWKNELPEGDTPTERVEVLVAYLQSRAAHNENGVELLITVLQERVDPNDCYSSVQ